MKESFSKPKTKSQLSLKSKAYNKPGDNNKKFNNSSFNSLDQIQKMRGAFPRNSLPQMPMEFQNNSYHFTPSTNYTLPSSEEKRSAQGQMLNPNMPMHILSPVLFQNDIHNNSHDGINLINTPGYSEYPKDGLMGSNALFNNTMPLPDMASFVPGPSYSPDVCMQEPYPYYIMNSGSIDRLSNNSDYFPIPQQQPPFMESNMGKSWPKIPQCAQGQINKFSTIQYTIKKGGRVITKENPEQKERYRLNFMKILRGEDNKTSLMIRNIPNKYNQVMLMNELDENHKGLYDYIYLPIDPKNKCNYGYAFINLIHPVIILSLYKEFNGQSWKNFNSEKI